MKECTIGIQKFEGGFLATREIEVDGEQIGEVKIFTNVNKAVAWIKEALV